MEIVGVLVLIPATIVLLVALISLRKRTAKKRNGAKFPPGNEGLPFVGETLSFLKPHPTTTVGKYMEHQMRRFGRIFSSNLMGSRTVVSADGELNRFVLKNEMKLFEPGWPKAFLKVVGAYAMPLVVGDVHKHMRSTLFHFLSAERRRPEYFQDVDGIAYNLIGSWKEDTSISVTDQAIKFCLNIMVKMVLSMNPGEPEIATLRTEYDFLYTGLYSLPIRVPGTAYWRCLQARDNIIKIFKKQMEQRMDKVDNNIDLLDWLMKNTDYSPEKICDLLLGVLIAGYDTTSRAIQALVYFLHGCPRAVQQLRDEHLRVVQQKKQTGECKLSWDDYKTMEFTKCVIKETLRLGNIASFVQKKTSEDVEFKGYVIPRGCSVIVHINAVHLDPSTYKDPNHFDPWRWMDSYDVKMSNNFMPFGGGVRLCLGSELGMLEMAVFLHHFILKYDWEPVELDIPINIPVTNFPKGLPIKVQKVAFD